MRDGRVNILVVDDQPHELLAIEASLESLDQNLVLARSGEEALRFLLQEEAAVILLDVSMPGLDGFEVARILKQRKRTRRIPIVFLSAVYRDERYTFNGYALGAVDYLHKPIEPEVLRQKVAVYVDLAIYEAELQARLDEVAAQKRLIEEIVANAPAGIAFVDHQLVFRAANALILGLLDRSSGQILNRPASEGISEHPWLLAALQRVQAERRTYRLPDLINGRQSQVGRPTYFELILHPLLEGSHELKGILLFGMDVTDRVQRERLQLEQIEALRKVDTMKDQFISILSHELRSPINAITGFGSILGDEVAGPLTSTQHQYIDKILGGADTLLALVNDLLDMNRIQAGKFQLDAAPMRIEQTVRTVTESLAPLADQKRQRLIAEVAEGLPPVVADQQRVGQVFVNLITNAIKFTPDEGTIRVRTRIEGDRLVCEVEDTGIGISEEDMEKLFKPFVQLDMSDTRRVGGSGLGLSISKALVVAHGGGRLASAASSARARPFGSPCRCSPLP